MTVFGARNLTLHMDFCGKNCYKVESFKSCLWNKYYNIITKILEPALWSVCCLTQNQSHPSVVQRAGKPELCAASPTNKQNPLCSQTHALPNTQKYGIAHSLQALQNLCKSQCYKDNNFAFWSELKQSIYFWDASHLPSSEPSEESKKQRAKENNSYDIIKIYEVIFVYNIFGNTLQ